MANPFQAYDNGEFNDGNDIINAALLPLYGGFEEEMTAPTTEMLVNAYDTILDGPIESGELEVEDMYAILSNLVLLDSALDATYYWKENPAHYHPERLLELIDYRREDIQDIEFQGRRERGPGDTIFYWASERLFPYFVEKLGIEEILEANSYDQTYLHLYLASSDYRIFNPAFVKILLDYGFSLSDTDRYGKTPLHYIVQDALNYNFDYAYVSKEEASNKSNYAVIKYNNFYRTLILVFGHPTANILIPDNNGKTVRDFLMSADKGVLVGTSADKAERLDTNTYGVQNNHIKINEARKNLLNAYNVSQGNPRRIAMAKKHAIVEQLNLPQNMQKMIGNVLGHKHTLKNARKAVKAKHNKQINNTKRHKEKVHNELLGKASKNGGRRTRRKAH